MLTKIKVTKCGILYLLQGREVISVLSYVTYRILQAE